MMFSICQHCKEKTFDDDDLVCKSCGIVSEGIQFGEEYTSVGYSFHFPQKKKLSQGLIYGLDILSNLCCKLNISANIKSEALELLKDVHSKKAFQKKEDIAAMGGCCLSHVQKKYNQDLPLSKLSELINSPMKQLYRFSMVLKKKWNYTENSPDDPDSKITNNQNSSKDWLPSVSNLLSIFPEENRASLIDKTVKLVELADSCWLVSGCSHEGWIFAASFLCWKNLYPCRKDVDLKKFFADYSLSHSRYRVKVNELLKLLVKLGSKIPSVTPNYVNRKNVVFHLNYILEHSETLRNDLLGREYNIDAISAKEFSSFRKPVRKRIQMDHNRTDCNIEDKSKDRTWSGDISDVEISDSEIDSYIRTEEQMQMIKNLREKNE